MNGIFVVLEDLIGGSLRNFPLKEVKRKMVEKDDGARVC